MNLSLNDYEKALETARRILSGKSKIILDEYDLVHEALALYGSVAVENLRKVYYANIEPKALSEDFRRLEQTKVCKKCPQEGPQPVGAFYIRHDKRNNTVYLHTLCIKCSKSEAVKSSLKLRDTEDFKRKHRAACLRWYHKKMKDPEFIQKIRKWRRESEWRRRFQRFMIKEIEEKYL